MRATDELFAEWEDRAEIIVDDIVKILLLVCNTFQAIQGYFLV